MTVIAQPDVPLTVISRPYCETVSPVISVIMPLLNAMPYLPASIDSILNQSFGNFELLIVDNGSTDGSKEYAESLRDPRIRVLSAFRRGTAYAINVGIRASRGEFLATMDADDISAQNRLEKQLEYLQQHTDVVLLGARFSFLIGDVLVPTAPPLAKHRDIVQALRHGAAAVTNGTAMFRRWAAKAAGGHRLNGPAHDFDFFLRMSEIGLVNNLQDTLYLYRLHDASSTATTTKTIRSHTRYALACARAREQRQPEPTYFAFSEVSQNRVRSFLADRALGLSAEMYRKALFQKAAGKHLLANISVLSSAALNPIKLALRVKRQIIGLRLTSRLS